MIHFGDVSKVLRKPHGGPTPVIAGLTMTIRTDRILSIHGLDEDHLTVVAELISGIVKPDVGRIYREAVRLSPVINLGGVAGVLLNTNLTVAENIKAHARRNDLPVDHLMKAVESGTGEPFQFHMPVNTLAKPLRRCLEVALIATCAYDCYLVDRFDRLPPLQQRLLMATVRARRAGMIFTSTRGMLARRAAEESYSLINGRLRLYVRRDREGAIDG